MACIHLKLHGDGICLGWLTWAFLSHVGREVTQRGDILHSSYQGTLNTDLNIAHALTRRLTLAKIHNYV